MDSSIGFRERILLKTMYTINIGQNQYQSCTYIYIFGVQHISYFTTHAPEKSRHFTNYLRVKILTFMCTLRTNCGHTQRQTHVSHDFCKIWVRCPRHLYFSLTTLVSVLCIELKILHAMSKYWAFTFSQQVNLQV